MLLRIVLNSIFRASTFKENKGTNRTYTILSKGFKTAKLDLYTRERRKL